MDSNVQIDIRKTCRTCLKVHKSRRELISIFNEDNFHHRNVKFSEMLTSVSNHRVSFMAPCRIYSNSYFAHRFTSTMRFQREFA